MTRSLCKGVRSGCWCLLSAGAPARRCEGAGVGALRSPSWTTTSTTTTSAAMPAATRAPGRRTFAFAKGARWRLVCCFVATIREGSAYCIGEHRRAWRCQGRQRVGEVGNVDEARHTILFEAAGHESLELWRHTFPHRPWRVSGDLRRDALRRRCVERWLTLQHLVQHHPPTTKCRYAHPPPRRRAAVRAMCNAASQ